MTTEQLLIPRYKVIADYPCRPHPIGSIIEFTNDPYDTRTLFTLPGAEHRYPESKFKEYPHLFKPLQWWEERKIEEMPAYVKQEEMVDSRNQPIHSRVIKVDTHWAATATKPFRNYKVFSSSEDPHSHLYSQMYFDWQPATEQEYLTYINSKK